MLCTLLLYPRKDFWQNLIQSIAQLGQLKSNKGVAGIEAARTNLSIGSRAVTDPLFTTDEAGRKSGSGPELGRGAALSGQSVLQTYDADLPNHKLSSEYSCDCARADSLLIFNNATNQCHHHAAACRYCLQGSHEAWSGQVSPQNKSYPLWRRISPLVIVWQAMHREFSACALPGCNVSCNTVLLKSWKMFCCYFFCTFMRQYKKKSVQQRPLRRRPKNVHHCLGCNVSLWVTALESK